MKPLIILTGPTAVGKTALSVRLAKAVGGEIISADSMQVYRHMDIGSAKVTRDEMEGIPHYLIDILEPTGEFNVAVFKKMAAEAVQEIYSHGSIPIVVGGTGFYIQALLYDIDFTEQGRNGKSGRNWNVWERNGDPFFCTICWRRLIRRLPWRFMPTTGNA